MKVKQSNKALIFVIVAIAIVVFLLVRDATKTTGTDYTNMTDEEIAVAVQNEIDQMNVSILSTKSERDRMEYYVSEFVEAVENKDYEEAYKMLYDDFKSNYFPTLSSFEEYAKSTFPSMISLDHTNIERNGDYYVLWVTMYDPIGGSKSSGIEMNFVIQEYDLNDYALSFSVI